MNDGTAKGPRAAVRRRRLASYLTCVAGNLLGWLRHLGSDYRAFATLHECCNKETNSSFINGSPQKYLNVYIL